MSVASVSEWVDASDEMWMEWEQNADYNPFSGNTEPSVFQQAQLLANNWAGKLRLLICMTETLKSILKRLFQNI
jgi:hypothetical protein